ncbi:sulfatase-like hydrolase/transferase [Fontimonas sp. SYSU GA230001]|uniref:LTA synthase family protein n=1 Tax=Fontimonas sp. SYSU GA230001 TaxID=3142450 RepID=UPI0032B336C9
MNATPLALHADSIDAKAADTRPPGRWAWLRPLLTMAVVYLLLSAATRLLLWVVFGRVDGVSATALPVIVGLGAINDFMQALYLLIPLSLFLALAPRPTPRARRLLTVGAWLMIAGMLFIGACEYFFFEEFDSRFNLVAVDYLIYPTEVIGDIRDEYPVVPLLAAIAVLAALATWALRSRLHIHPQAQTPRGHHRLLLLAGHAGVVAAVTLFWTADALAVFSNRVANELTANGPARFFAALNSNHIDYPVFYRSGDATAMFERLTADLGRGGGSFVDLPGGDLTRRFDANPAGLGKLNVVVLVEESLGAEYVGAYGDTRGLTPEFDRLSREGLLFTRAYATGTRTVRGLEALTASLPPIPSESIVKRPGNEGIATWGKVMNQLGYQSSFLYGGYGAFDNMNHYFGSNGFAILDRSQLPPPRFANIWGVSDEDLLHAAVEHFDQRAGDGRPFFAVIMSTSNHKPYTFPDGVEGVPPRGGGRKAGVRYADHAIGEFMRAAATRPWFRDTLFVIVADHDARVYGRADIPLNTYEIPLLIYAPAHIRPGRIDTPTSQIDVAPTVLGLLGLPYEAPFFGQDVLAWPKDQPRTLLFNHNHDVAVLSGDRLCILGLRKEAHCQRYERLPGAPGAQTTRFGTLDDDPEVIDLAVAYYQTAYDLFTQRRYR